MVTVPTSPWARWSVGSLDGRYRWLLGRRWDPDGPWLLVVGLNPSTADGSRDDPTSRRCVGFPRAWGFGGVLLANLHGLRATHPEDLRRAADPVGAWNDRWLARARRVAGASLAAWGDHGCGVRADALLSSGTWWTLGRTMRGAPRHPLYVRGDVRPVPWEEACGP